MRLAQNRKSIWGYPAIAFSGTQPSRLLTHRKHRITASSPHSQIDDVGLKAVNHQLCASYRIDLSNAALNDTSVFSSVSLKYQIGHTDGPLRRNTRYQERIFRCPLHRRYRWWVLLSYSSFASVQSARTADISAAVSFAPGRSCSLQLPHS